MNSISSLVSPCIQGRPGLLAQLEGSADPGPQLLPSLALEELGSRVAPPPAAWDEDVAAVQGRAETFQHAERIGLPVDLTGSSEDLAPPAAGHHFDGDLLLEHTAPAPEPTECPQGGEDWATSFNGVKLLVDGRELTVTASMGRQG